MKKNKMKKKIRLLSILLLITIMLNACGNNKQSEGKEITEIVFGSHMDTEINNIHKDGEEITYSVRVNNGRVMCKTTAISGTYFYNIDDNFNKTPFQIFNPVFTDVLDYTLDSEGNVYFILLEAIDGEENIYLRKYAADGGETNVKWLNEFHKGDKDDCYEWKVVIAPDKNILVYSNLGYLLIDQAGETLKQESWEEERIYGVLCLDEDLIFFQHYINFERKISKVDKNTGTIQQMENIPSSVYFDIVKYTDHTVLMRSDSELFKYDYKEESMESLFRWSDYGIIGDHILMIYIKDNLLHCLVYEKGNLYDVSLMEDETGNQKTEIILGCIGENMMVRNAVVQFNKSNSDYRITVADYWNEDENLAINNMYHDILTGRGPDIIRMDSYMDDSMLGEKGLLEDLNLYLDSSNVIGKEDIVENIYDLLLCDDKLYMLPTNFELETMISNKKWVPETKNWNVDDIISIIDANPGIEKNCFSKNTMLYYFVLFSLETSRDSENHIIDEDLLRKYLELANHMPDEDVFIADDTLRRDGKILFESRVIDCMKTFMYKKTAWGPDYTFVGFPDVKGNGMMIIPENCYGISTQSAHKDTAWEFIESFFTDEWQEEITPNYDFSVCSKMLDKQFEESMKIVMYTDREGNQQEAPILTYLSGGEYIDVYAAREDDINDMKDMINGAEVIQRNKLSVINIVQEEAASYFDGQISIDEVIEIIKVRVNLLLNE